MIDSKSNEQTSVPAWVLSYPWYERATFYHIYPLGMCGAPKFNTGGEPVNRIRELIGIIPHLKRMSIGAIYIGPLFESVGHGYETTDYCKIDRRLGDNEVLKELVREYHRAGIKVVVDGVFNHTGREFFAFKDLKEKRESSEFRSWYCNVNFYGNNEFNDHFSYEAWHGYNILPRLNLKNASVKEYLKEVIQFWVSEFDIDGIRLDTADVLDFDFMKELRILSRIIKPDFWLMGEVIHGDYSRWVNQDMLHSVTNYELHKGLYSGHNDHNYFEIAHTIRRLFDQGGIIKSGLLYAFIENQDVDRLYDKLKNKKHMKIIYMLLFTLPGIPSIYYGGEFGILGKHENGSDDGLRPRLLLNDYMQGDKVEDSILIEEIYGLEYTELLSEIAWLSHTRNHFRALVGGIYKELLLTNRQYAFARIIDNEAVIVAVNNDENTVAFVIKLPFGEMVKNLRTGEIVKTENGLLKINLLACEGIIFVTI